MCFADISTGVVYAPDTEEWVDVYNELARFSPREILAGGFAISFDEFRSFITERLEEALVEPIDA